MNIFKYTVYYEDTDAGGVVYYANYLKFLERARTDFLKSKNILQSMLANDGIFFVVKKCEIEYIYPARLDNTLAVSCNIQNIGGASIDFLQEISCGRVLVKAMVRVVCVKSIDGTFRPASIPKCVKDAL